MLTSAAINTSIIWHPNNVLQFKTGCPQKPKEKAMFSYLDTSEDSSLCWVMLGTDTGDMTVLKV